MKARVGHTYRIYDAGRVTIALGGAYVCDGPHRAPRVDITYRQTLRGQGAHGGDAIRYRRASLPMGPHLHFHTAYRFRRVGGLRVYRVYSRVTLAICRTKRAGGA